MEKIKRILNQHWLIILITLIAVGLRFYRLSAGFQFLGDQGRDALVWHRLFVEHDLPFIGPITSVGSFFLGPLYYYLMAPFYWLSGQSPLGPVYATAALGSLTVVIIYCFSRKLFDQPVALWASGLYAMGVIPVAETRSAWNPNLMPLVVLGIVYGFYQLQQTKKLKWLYLSALSLGVALQLHYMIVFFSPFLGWQLYRIAKAKQLRRGLIVWLIIVVVLLLPLILFEIKNRFLNSTGLLAYLSQHRYGQLDLWQNFKNLKGRSEEAMGMILGFGRQTSWLRTWLTRGFLLGILVTWLKQPSQGFKLVSLWLLLTIGAIAFYQDNIPPYYLGFIFPAVFILTGYFLSRLKNKLLPFCLAFLFLFAWVNLLQLKTVFRDQGNFKNVLVTAQFIKADVEKNDYQDYNLTLIDGTRDYKAMAFRYFVKRLGGRPLGDDEYPQTRVLYVISPYVQSDLLIQPQWEISSMLPATVSSQWQFKGSENIYKIERL